MDIKAKVLTVGLAAATLFCSVSVSAATWTTAEVKGSAYDSPNNLHYGAGDRYLHTRGITGTGNIKIKQVNSWALDTTVAEVNTEQAVNKKDYWASKATAANGTPQAYQYIWRGSKATSAANIRVSDTPS